MKAVRKFTCRSRKLYLPHPLPSTHQKKPAALGHPHGSFLFSLSNYGPKMLRAGVSGGSVGGWAAGGALCI